MLKSSDRQDLPLANALAEIAEAEEEAGEEEQED